MSDRDENWKQAQTHPDPAQPAELPTEPAARGPRLPLQPEDFYWEGPYLVFTAAYHLRRGFCCSSGCRHCPYK